MPKKSKVNKLARMSDEERARYLQHRADVEEEARRRKRELIARFIKNKLDKEETYSRKNTAKINQEWRYILRKIKCKQMSIQIQGMMSTFNYLIERKDRLIKTLTKAIEDSDDQHRRAFQAHTETVGYFIGIGSQRLEKLQSEYEYQKITLLENWDKEEFDLSDSQDRAEFKLKLILYIHERDFLAFKKEKDLERATVRNDVRLEHEEEMRSLCCPKQLEIEMYWTKLREVYTSYLEKHNPVMPHYCSLKEKDEFYQRDIAKNEMKIQQATESLQNLQSEWIKTTTNIKDKLTRMTSRKEELSRQCWQMKREEKVERNKGHEKLELMVNSSQDAIERLEEVKEKIKKILQMNEICSKYEHEGDAMAEINAENSGECEEFENLDGKMTEECKQYTKMEKFLLKANKAQVQTVCLRNEKNKLAKENAQLKNYIKRYLTELALNNKERPASMKIQSAAQKINVNGKLLNRPVTCIEGALSNAVMHEKRMKTFDKKNKEMNIKAYPRVQCWM